MPNIIPHYAPDDAIRGIVGLALSPAEVREKAGPAAEEMLAHRADYAETIERVRRERLYHFRESGVYGARYLLGRILENQKKAKA